MITNLNYPTRAFRRLPDYSWSEISSISAAGEAPIFFHAGESKGGATLVSCTASTMVFSLGNVGSACIQRDTPYSSDHLNNSYLSVKNTGWYLGTSYASGAGITLDSVWNYLSQDLRAVIKTVTKSFKRAIGTTQSSSSGTFTLYPPTYSEWMSYIDYLPSNEGVFWLRDAKRFLKDYEGATIYYKEGSWFETYNTGDTYHGDAGYGWTGTSGGIKEGITNENLVLLFEV